MRAERVNEGWAGPEDANGGKAPVMEVRGLHRWLGEGAGRVHVLKGIDLKVEAGLAYAVVGPSGCGKSTLLYLLGLLDKGDDGEIYVAGEPVGKANDDRRTAIRNRSIGFVFQFHFLLPEFTALENVMLPMKRLGRWSMVEMEEKAHELLRQMGLETKTRRLANQLSGGEQQRVAVARSMANEPAIVLADEPTGNLDAKNSSAVFDLLQKVAHDRGQSVVMVSHNPALAERCDIVLRMEDGLFVSG